MFKYQFFYVPVLGSETQQQALNEFLSRNKILHVEKQLVAHGEQSYWSFCIQYAQSEPGKSNSENRRPKIDYKDVLNEQEFTVFAALRELRKKIAETEGVPVFAIFTNEQLAKMAQENTRTKSQMSQIDGVGDAKLSKYAEVFLAKVAEMTKPIPDSKG